MATTKIREALELLRERGWWKGSAGSGPPGSKCMGTSLGNMEAQSWLGDLIAMRVVIAAQFPDRLVANPSCDAGVVIFFNDHPDTTFADVELVMEKAAVMREESVDG